jgi:hypothetical protein
MAKTKHKVKIFSTYEYEGNTYYYCKYTGRYWLKDKMIFDKDKPLYSKLGGKLYKMAKAEISSLTTTIADKAINSKDFSDELHLLNKINEEMEDYDFLLFMYENSYDNSVFDGSIA